MKFGPIHDMADAELDTKILGLSALLHVRDVAPSMAHNSVTITIDLEPNAALQSPKCFKKGARYDSKPRM
jgi:hypothetical protein